MYFKALLGNTDKKQAVMWRHKT